MKVTVSSTSMMKPILYTPTSKLAKHRHPQRILGLLEGVDHGNSEVPITTYSRPFQSQSDATPAQGQCLLHIPDAQSQPCVAIFGFQFDGKNTWYQAWNQTAGEACWLKQKDGLEYQPYAIIAMDALVTLLPRWDGEIYLNLALASQSASTEGTLRHSPCQELSRDYDLLISDAAATTTGKLWFLVNVKAEYSGNSAQLHSQELHTGWISQTPAATHAA